MGIFRNFPYSNFHDLNLDWIIRTIKDLVTDWDDFTEKWIDDLYDTINEWITAHPEYVTTVVDHSLTSSKFSDKIPFYNVADYGITPNTGDIYDSLYDLFADHVYNTGGVVFFPKGNYTISDTIFIPENTIVIGEGKETEIYFDETYLYFGTGLSNAGSNITISNMKFSQKSQGVFGSGSQPGSIGFSDWHKDMARKGKHANISLRNEVKNLCAENLYFDGIYALQTENSDDYKISNVIYKNIYAPVSCISVMGSTKGIYNIKVDNIECDLFRIDVNIANGIIEDYIGNNITCQKIYINHHNLDGKIIINNLVQTGKIRMNTLISTFNAIINGNVTFNNCKFVSTNDETYGFSMLNGIRTFNNCEFFMSNQVLARNASLSDTTNYEIMNNNIIHNKEDSERSFLIGYGKNNIVDYPDRIYKDLWGDMHYEKVHGFFDATNDVTSLIPSKLHIVNDRIRITGYHTMSNVNLILPVKTVFETLPIEVTNIPIIMWNVSNRADTEINTFAKIESRYLKVQEPDLNATAYNRIIYNADLIVTRTPTPTEIYNLIHS